jgi:hypothetical protein
MHRSRLTSGHRDRLIAKIERLRWDISDLTNRARVEAVIRRIKWWMAADHFRAEVESNAQWLSLYDMVCANYATCRLTTAEAFEELRWLGIHVYQDTDQFPRDVEMARALNSRQMVARFNAVTWELGHNQRKLAVGE